MNSNTNTNNKHISFYKINNNKNVLQNENNNNNILNNTTTSYNNNNNYNFKNKNDINQTIINYDDDDNDDNDDNDSYNDLNDMELENFKNNNNYYLNNDNKCDNSDDLDDLDFEFGNGIKSIKNNHNTINTNNPNIRKTTPLITNKIEENDLLLISKPTTSAKLSLPAKTQLTGFLNNDNNHITNTTSINFNNTSYNNNNNNSNSNSFSSILYKNKSSIDGVYTPKQKISLPSTSLSNNSESIKDGNIIKNKVKNNNNNSIVTIYENKTREIGYSSYNQETGEIETGQFCDSQTYFHLYNKLFILNPSILVIPPIEQNIELVKLIGSRFPNAKIIPIVRKLFNENEGISLIRQLCLLDKLLFMEKFIKDKILSQCSFSALIKYLEQEITLVKNCVRIKYSGSENSMHIDAETIKNLELIHSSKDGSRNCTLYDAINYTKTSQGSRLLISAIVQPSNDIDIIKHRQSAIKQLLSNEKTIYTLTPILSKIQDIDKILLLFSQQNKKIITIKSIENFIKNFIDFKNIFELLPKIFNLLNDNIINNNAMLIMIRNNLSNQNIEELYGESNKVINSKVPIVKNQVNTSASKIISYIKDGVNGLLDVCKKTYKEIIQDINILLKFYQDQHKIPQLKLHYCLTKGYYFSLPCKNKNLFHLPTSIFIRQTFRNQKCYFFSDELSSLSRRCKEVFEEIIILSAQSIERLIEFYRARISELYNLSESISQLDFLVSGALYSLQLDQSVCPEIFESGSGRVNGSSGVIGGSSPLAIKAGYHPLQLRKSKKHDHHYHVSDFVPNDTLINETSCFQLIHGCNMSGKSTYIQQVALLTILGHIGYFLPAEFATIPIIDQIISRLGTSDNIQSNASTFMTEMKEISYILENATENSLVIIDELGRGTSNMDGSSIAWAISENLSQISCFTLFVTHYQQLLHLGNCYPNIRIYHFQVSKDDHSGTLKYNYLLSEGVSDVNTYGIDTAELAGIDQKVIQSAKYIRNILESSSPQISKSNNNNQYHHPSRDSYQLLQKILNLKHSKLTDIQLKEYLLKLKNEFSFN